MTVWSIAFSPLLPFWALYPLAMLALIASITLVLRRARGAWLRSLAFTLLFVGLCDPNLVHENRRPLKDIAAVVVDRSASQTIGERPRQTDMALDRTRGQPEGTGRRRRPGRPNLPRGIGNRRHQNSLPRSGERLPTRLPTGSPGPS